MTKERECGAKVAYPNRERAMDAAMSRMRQRGATRSDTQVYKCGVCGKYHVGHAKGAKRRRRRQW